MKVRSREINIFSMSALDLFASALGAFIMIAVLLLPYFPNTGLTTEDVAEQLQEIKEKLAETTDDLEETKGKLADAESDLEKSQNKEKELEEKLARAASANAPKAKFPPLDLILALDTTNSMGSQVQGLRENIRELTEILITLADDVGVGIVDFRDRCYPPTMVRTFPLQKITRANIGQLRRFTQGMEANSDPCNPDQEEAMAEALDASIAMNWRDTTKKRQIILMSDNPPYRHMVASANAAAAEFSNRTGAKHSVSTVLVNTGKDRQAPGTPQILRQLAQSGKGKYTVEGRGASFTVTVLRALVDQ